MGDHESTLIEEDASAESRASRVGQVVAGKYKLVRLLGEGGMGAVYEAHHVMLKRRFAMKFVHPELARRADVMGRFRREAQTAGSLENENIAAITDLGTAEDGAPYIVMEYLSGSDLSNVLAATGPMPVPRAAHLLIQACRGLSAAHEKGITHRDLKPENLFICKRGDGGDLVKILDFGIAKLKDGDGSTQTQTGSAIGTPFYMPPEQARGAKDLDHRADIYALGVILYELLSCAKPHPGEGYNAILFHILTKPPTPLLSLRPNLPEGLVAAVEKAMAPEAGDRFATTMELAQALAPFVGRAITPNDKESTRPPAHSKGSETLPTPVALTEMEPMSRGSLPSFGELSLREVGGPPSLRGSGDRISLENVGDRASSHVSRGASMTVPEEAAPKSSPKLALILGAAFVVVLLGVVVVVFGFRKTDTSTASTTASIAPPVRSTAEAPAPTASSAPAAMTADSTPAPAPTPSATSAKSPPEPKGGSKAGTGTATGAKPRVDVYAP